jgi:hypothetical protein
MMINLSRTRALVAAWLVALTVCVTTASAETETEDDWTLRFIPYLWTSSLTGNIGPAVRPATVDLDFSDILEMTEIGFTGAFDASYRDDWTILAEGQYLELEESARGPLGNSVTIESDFKVLGVVLAKRMWPNIDLYAGGRYIGMDTTVSLAGGPSVGDTQDWIDPIVGFRMKGQVSERIFLRLAMDIGGFGVNSDLTYGMAANFNYIFNDRYSLIFGYRLLDVEYDKDDFVFDVKMDGLLIGFGISW